MDTLTLGIDVSKKRLEVALLGGPQRQRGTFDNQKSGFAKLVRWLKKHKAKQAHICLESTGNYWLEVAFHLHQAGCQVSVVNPRRIKKHGEAIMQRHKSDRVDAQLIADFAAKHAPPAWEPPPPAWWQLRGLVRHRQALVRDRTREVNRAQAGSLEPAVAQMIEQHLTFLKQQIDALDKQIAQHIDHHPDLKQNHDLLTSIPGVGDITAATFQAEVPDVHRFDQASDLATYAGLTPAGRQSGSSLNRPPKLLKVGNRRLRTAFFMPALSAHRRNPITAALRQRLLERGKKKMTVVVAVMRKLLHLCYGVLKTGQPFDPNWCQSAKIA